MNVLEDHPLDKLNTFGINVRSKYLIEVSSIEEILEIIESEKFKKISTWRWKQCAFHERL